MSNLPAARYLDRTTPPHVSTLVLMTGMATLVMNMFLPSLPAMADFFHADYRVMQLSVALFLAANAVLQIIIGPISDRFGRRPVIMAGIVVFLAATLGCIFAPTVEAFLAFRVVQASVVVLMVLSRAAVRDMYDQDKAASVIGYVTMGMALVPLVSPAIGGYLGELFGWQANFWAMFICGCLTLWLVLSDLGETHVHRSANFRGQIANYPELLISVRFWGYAAAAAFSSGAFFAYLGGAPYVGSELFGLDPSHLGLMLGTPALGYSVGNFLSGRYAVRFGINRMILVGALITAVAMGAALIFYSGLDSIWSYFSMMLIVGLGNGMVIPNATAGTLSVRPKLAGTASGLGGALMLGGGAALSAWSGSLLKPGSGAYPLLWMQFVVLCLSVVAILLVIRREKSLGFA